ncbi:hypothetical protein F4775DRAFT_68213 [Biscogniauxia sp. FL1348]|nr:hypothetical protein F4775DRAFT_68213 [Biscogniauxia sp. FL1348]
MSQMGLLKDLETILNKLDELDRDDLIDFICPGKHLYAWNLQPSKEGKSGSIEFRRAPSVVTTEKAKHWIAFTMAFIWMSLKFESQRFIDSQADVREHFRRVFQSDFQRQLLNSAQDIGEHWNLDSLFAS